MQINLRDHLQNDTMIDHIVVHCLGKAGSKALSEVAENYHKREDGMMDIQLIIDGHEAPIEDFAEHWQKQVDRMIAEKAEELIKEKFACINDAIFDLETAAIEKLKDIDPNNWRFNQDED